MITKHDKDLGAVPSPDTWRHIIKDAYSLLDDLRDKRLGEPSFSLGGGTALMLSYRHRLSKDIDLFAYDVQWLSLLSPRLNEKAAAMSLDYVEQANSVKIVTAAGDIDFIVAADVTKVEKTLRDIAGRKILVDPPSEILAKKLFYRPASLKPRDVYDMSAVIDLAPGYVRLAARAARSKKNVLLRRLDELADLDQTSLLSEIVPYDGPLRHSTKMVAKVRDFVVREIHDTNQADDRPTSKDERQR